MTVEEGGGGGGGDVKEKKKRTVLVGIRLDKIGRELLNWALVKVAEPGDRVIALHARKDTDPIDSKENTSLDSYLEVYKGLCNVKQLDLTGQISRGNSVRKILVREAKVCGAMAIVVGVSRKNTLGTWVYVAKYCAKRLQPSTAVLAIHNGKVVFQRGFTKQLSGINGDPKPSLEHSELRLPEIENQSSTQIVQRSESFGTKLKHKSFSLESAKKRDRVSPRMSSCGGNAIRHSVSLDVNHVTKEMPESRPGWPLLRSTVSVTPNRKEFEARKMSVVQWVMSLPNRTSSPTLETQTGFAFDKTEIQFKSESIDCRSKSTKNCLEAWGELPKELELLLKTNSSNCRWFCHKELKSATSDFSSENLIGKGGCSRVYKAFLSDGKPVAVKVLKVSKQSWKDFILEVDIISVLKHKNITPLIGVCIDNNDLILVYNFLSKGSLEENLHGKEQKSALSWEVRFKMAIGIAEAISYLHNECPRPVIHRDIKSSNVLLNDDLEPQLSDFGLAAYAPTSSSHTQSDVVGTFGYLAPEYFMYGKVSDKIDVYSYGVVLLELLSGRRPISTETPKGQESLVMWAKPILESGDIHGILDPDLIGNFDEVQMRKMVLAVTLCLTRAARLRPHMKQILNLLQGGKDVEMWVNSDTNNAEEDNQDVDEAYPESSVESHLGVALQDVEDESTSFSSIEQSNHHSLEDYLKGRWSRSSSFD